ncbi:hypothetical protein GCM10010430_31580 [Kitasatospora cystarginea]|uniref:Uncharacterized protein n=1 Tax=Kitasatospora cystarginea TaxID=58350 RepID=A0ABN3E2S7_9ACTN
MSRPAACGPVGRGSSGVVNAFGAVCAAAMGALAEGAAEAIPAIGSGRRSASATAAAVRRILVMARTVDDQAAV